MHVKRVRYFYILKNIYNKVTTRNTTIRLVILCLFISLGAQSNNDTLTDKKQRLQELLGLEPDGPLNEGTYEILAQEIEFLGIEEDELIDGYEFIGGYWGFQEYLDNNIDRLLGLLDDESDSESLEYDEDDEYDEDELYVDDFWYNDPEYADSDNEDEKKIDKSRKGKNKTRKKKSIQQYTFSYYMSSPIVKSYTIELYERYSINGMSINTPLTIKIGSLEPSIIVELRNYRFDQIVADSIVSTIGGEFSFLIGLRRELVIKDNDIGISVLTGKFPAGGGIIFSGDTKIPFELGNVPVGLGTYVRVNAITKSEGGITGWVDLGISLNYSLTL